MKERLALLSEATERRQKAQFKVYDYMHRMFQARHGELQADPLLKLTEGNYHVFPHFFGTADRTGRILYTAHRVDPIYVTEEDIFNGMMAGLLHDIKYDWGVQKGQRPFPSLNKRMPLRGVNELASAEEFRQVMELSGYDWWEIKDAYEGIAQVTVPAFDIELKTIVQPNLQPSTSPVARALGLADIGCGGMESPEVFIASGFKVLREDFPELKDHVARFESLKPELQTEIREGLLAWIDGQVDFILGRQALLSDEVAMHDRPEVRNAVLALFSFDEAIRLAREQATLARTLSDRDLFQMCGLVKREDVAA